MECQGKAISKKPEAMAAVPGGGALNFNALVGQEMIA